ncbi:hypothetical protein [Tateyamaria sp.]|uniref:hypothetical protein n=1 Tax=Tateyamaria sp. TaxID=1929288 RepID=UPI003B20EC7E
MTRFDVARTQQPKSTAAYGSLRFGPLRYQLKRTIGMLPTPDNSECSRQAWAGQTAPTWPKCTKPQLGRNHIDVWTDPHRHPGHDRLCRWAHVRAQPSGGCLCGDGRKNA